VPQDPVVSLMSFRGVDVSIQHDDIYEKVYKELNLDLPGFYFSVRPNYYPKTVNHIPDPKKKDLYKKLLKSGYSYLDINLAIDDFSQSLESAKTVNNSKELIELNSVYNLEHPEFHDAFEMLKNKKVNSFFYPAFHWNGLNNQYHHWLIDVFTNGFGVSIHDGKKAIKKVKKALIWTLSITMIDFFLSLFFGVFIGVYLAKNENGKWQKFFSQVMYFLFSIPIFWFATLMVVYFTTDDYGWWTNWFPSVSIDIYPGKSVTQQILLNAEKLILPITILTLHSLAFLTRFVRRSILDELDKPYASLAYSKGLSKKEVIMNHTLKNALIPLITTMASAFANAFAGSLVLEVIFNIPGMGRLLISSMGNADWNVVFCITLLLSFVTVVAFIIADLFYAYFNPKIKLSLKN